MTRYMLLSPTLDDLLTQLSAYLAVRPIIPLDVVVAHCTHGWTATLYYIP